MTAPLWIDSEAPVAHDCTCDRNFTLRICGAFLHTVSIPVWAPGPNPQVLGWVPWDLLGAPRGDYSWPPILGMVFRKRALPQNLLSALLSATSGLRCSWASLPSWWQKSTSPSPALGVAPWSGLQPLPFRVTNSPPTLLGPPPWTRHPHFDDPDVMLCYHVSS